MAIIKYRDKDGKLKDLVPYIYIPNTTTDNSVYVGDIEPIDPSCRVWYDTSRSPAPVAKCRLKNGDWLEVAGGDGSASNIHIDNKEPDAESDYALWIDTSKTNPVLKYKNELGGWTPVSGGGASTGEDTTIPFSTNWKKKTITFGSPCVVEYEWNSFYGGSDTGQGTFELFVTTVNGEERKEMYRVPQTEEGKPKPVDITKYLALGTTEITIRVTDKYGRVGQAILEINTVNLSMKESFVEARAYTSKVTYYCTPEGARGRTKKMYVLLDDEPVVDGMETLDDNIQQEYDLTEFVRTHGTHKICAYFTCQLEEGADPIPSNKVYSEFAYIANGDTMPIVVANCGINKIEEYDTISFDWHVFTPNSDGTTADSTPLVQIYHSKQPELTDGAKLVQTLENVGYGSTMTHEFKGESVGDNYIIFKVGEDYERPIYIEVTKSPVIVSAVTTNLILNLSPRYHTQSDPNRTQWVSDTPNGQIIAQLEKFNFMSDGWMQDDSLKNTILRVRDEAMVSIPIDIFTEDTNSNGMVIEFELATHDVLDYEATIVECMNNGIGIEIKANQAMLKTKNNTLITPFREGEQVRVTFVIESNSSPTKLLLIYINGVLSGAKQYTSSDNFAQDVAQDIKIGSDKCATDIYAIRVYKATLDRRDILANWIADTQDRELMLERYNRNKLIFDKTSLRPSLHPDHLPEGLPYMVFYTNEQGLPQAKGKGEERSVDGKYIDSDREFTFVNSELKVQGTSSSGYPRKNFTQTFSDTAGEGIVFTGERDGISYTGQRFYDFKMFDDSIPVSSFCFKTDYASSEGANNVELVKLFNDLCVVLGDEYQIPPQISNNNIRQGIDGFPMVIFCYYDNAYYFIGKYNFNNDKGTPEVFGMTEGVESWEILNNEGALGEYKESDLKTVIYDSTAGGYIEKWTKTFEARYPEDYDGIENLQEMISWVRSTWKGEADPDKDIDEVTYEEKPIITVNAAGEKKITWSKTSVTYTKDTEEYRIAKFRNEASNWFDVEHLQFFYLFTDFFLMIDNRKKNTFPTRYFDPKINKWLWYFLPYDFDTALGINNSGELVFGHGLEDIDEGVYNGADSVLWCNVRDYFKDKIADLYVRLRKTDIFNYEEISKRFTEHQRAWGEAVFNEDSYYKYIAVMLGENGTSEHLPKLQGSKEAQRNHWLYNRFRYFDARYVTQDVPQEIIILRPNYVEGGYNYHSFHITPFSDTYLSINYDAQSSESKPIPLRAFKGAETYFDFSDARPDNGVVHIYNASQITDLGDLSGQYTSEFVGNSATRLQRLILGNDGFDNTFLNHLSLGSNRLLKVLNVKRCPNLGGDIDISGCTGIEEVYFDGTSITSVVLPRGGTCKVLYLPNTITNLTIINHKITEFSLPNADNLTTLWLELNEVSKNTFDLKEILGDMINRFKNSTTGEKGRLRVREFELTGDKGFDTAQEVIDFYTDIRKCFKGLDANGVAGEDETSLKNMLKGKIEIREDTIYSSQLEVMKEKFPSVEILYTHIASFVTFYVMNELACQPIIVRDEGYCPDPITSGIIDTPYVEDDTSKYEFIEWDYDLENENIIRDTVVTAKMQEYKKYKFYFKDYKGDTVYDYVCYDKDGERSVTVPVGANYSKVINGDSYDYHFEYWVNTVTGEKLEENTLITIDGAEFVNTYEAVYSEHRVYIVKFVFGENDETELRLYANGKINVPERVPTKAETYQYTYTFDRWVDANGNGVVENVGTEDRVYTPVFTPVDRYYQITFICNGGTMNGETSKTFTVKHDVMPTEVEGYAEPVKEGTVQYYYPFTGWSPEVVPARENVTYRANYERKTHQYTVTWKVGGQTETITYYYGDTPVVPSRFRVGTTVTDGKSTYAITGWSMESTVTRSMIYTPTATANLKNEEITARPTKKGYATDGMSGVDGFLAGTGYIDYTSLMFTASAILYGFKFEELRPVINASNFVINGFSLSIESDSHSSSYHKVKFVKAFDVSGEKTSYTDISSTEKSYGKTGSSSGGIVTTTFTGDDFPEVLEYIQNNMSAIVNGCNNTSFGLRITTDSASIYKIEVTLTYSVSASITATATPV